ncbi:TetR family transcriptional regulator [Streptomyces marianii]|uniref:TetR family transcriptional regulator n=1 Tax=Streptomyces marianii TaxID=1817406 RepID=A0A5R9EF79_9ACTN|nr:TetR family transcriptional regulator [Streptomyces marianii]
MPNARWGGPVSGAPRTNTRDIARAAVRAELAEVAFGLFRRKGFDNVTVNDLAAAAGVSRSTFLRYFGTKEDAVLSAFDTHGERIAEALRVRPAAEGDLRALRAAMDVVVGPYRQDPEGALALARLVRETPALCARQLERQRTWHPLLEQALAERAGPSGASALARSVKAAAALDCLNIAVDHWTASDGVLDLIALLDGAFAALSP